MSEEPPPEEGNRWLRLAELLRVMQAQLPAGMEPETPEWDDPQESRDKGGWRS